MKKIISLMIVLLATVVTTFAAEKTVWEGSEPISWNTEVAPGTQFETPSGTFTGLAKGDVIRAYTTTTYESPQYVMTYKKGEGWDWTDLEISVTDGVLSYTVVDETTATEIADRGLVFRGQAYTLTKITVETPEDDEPEPTLEGTVIYNDGDVVMGTAWDKYIQLAASNFTALNPGAVIRVYIKDVLDDVQAIFQDGEWQNMEGVDAVYPAATDAYYELTTPKAVLDIVKEKGLIIKGKNFTAYAVTITAEGTPEDDPDPEPATPVFDEDGVADLSKIEVQDAEKVSYDAETHTVTTTEGWTGVQLTVTDGEEVSGKELRITFDREMKVKCYVKYVDETDADVIMDEAENILYFTLDETKKLYQVQIQPTEAATFAFQEIKINAESTKPEPQPEPATPVFDEDGVADLSKIEVQDAEKVTYDVETHTVTTTAGWTGVQLTVTDGEEVSGKELRITFDREMAVKCYVKYTDETDADVIMDEAEKILYFTLDDTKKLYQVQIQPTDAATFAFEEIKVNQESTKPEPEPEPATPVFNEDGIADLSKIEVQDAEKVTYDVETHTVTTTAGWTGVQLTVTDGEEVSGKELRITFDREMKVKCYVKYTDETDADVIMDEAENILYFTLDETKKLYQVQIQPTEAATFAFQEIKINAESTKPEPQPEPATPVFDEDGVADLSKIEVQDAEKVSYDAETHTVTTTAGWTGVQLTVTDGEEVSGKELRITFDRAMKVKCYVKYMDETDADVIMDDAAEILYFELDETKKLYQVQVQPTDAATFAFQEIKINAESTKPEPQPEPATPVFDEDGVADLSKIEVQDAEKVSYDAETHTVTTTEGWTGVQLTVTDGEEVSGKELRITFDRAMKVKCYVKYMDETDADVIMDDAAEILYFELDETKKLYQVQVQPTDAATFAFQEIKVNQKSTKPEPEPQPEPGEKTRTENAQKLFDVLTSLYGNKIISGTTAVVDWNTKEAEQVYQWTNKYPAINTYDFINIHASKDVNPEGWLDYSDISGVKKWAAEGGVVSAMWHWQVKDNAGTGYTCTPGTGDLATSFDASKVYVDGTAENTLAKQQLSQICGYLKKMQDAGIPVIWRPFHEAAGNTYDYDGGKAWFWWGAQGADVYKQLWQWMYNYMVNEQGLHNLIWVWTSQTKDGIWYPGNDYVDIIGRDIYAGGAAQQKSDFDHLTAGYSNMMVALSECGNTKDASQSDISAVWEAGAKWSWFSTWYDAAGSQLHNTQNWWTNAFSQDYVVTRDQMKELLNFNIQPDPEPQPEPGTDTFDENGVADLSKIEVQGDKVSYDPATHTVTTTEGWTGVQLTVADGEQVSGKELRITFDRAMKVKCYVKYLDETDASVIMDDAAEILYFELDNTKKLYQVQVQPTEAATFAFKEIRVNSESTKPVVKPLADGEIRTLFEDEEGVVMTWNEICQMNEEWGSILEAGEYFLVTVKSRTEGSEWPKVILRDATSTEAAAVELGNVTSYPYIVKMVLTEDVTKQLKNGFRFSGDGITITKIEIAKPAPAKEGDVSINAMNWMRTAVYDAESCMMTTTARWGQAGWEVGDDRYQDKTLVIVNIEPANFPVTLKLEYVNTDDRTLGFSVGVSAGKTQLNLPLPLDTKVINKVYLTYAESASIVLTDASVVSAANARPLTGEEIVTGIEHLTSDNSEGESRYYNLNGQRIQKPVKGLYIIDGKKRIQK